MINVTANAACSIAMRNAILAVIPQAIAKTVYDAAYKTAFGNASTFKSKLDTMIAYYAKLGISLDRVLDAVDCKGVDDVTMEKLATLRGIANSVKDGEMSLDEAFPVEKPETRDAEKPKDKPKTKTDEMAERFGATKKKTEPKPDVGTPDSDEIATNILNAIQAATDIDRLAEIRDEVGELFGDKVLLQIHRDDLIGFIDARVTDIEGK
jgi:hypothetical protein